MTDLVARLREAIDETERIAQAAGSTWSLEGDRDEWLLEFDTHTTSDIGFYDEDALRPNQARHIVRHDPAAVLRRCAADRKILDPHKPMQWAFKWIGPMDDRQRVPDMRCSACWTDYDPDGKFDHECHHSPHDWPCDTVLALAEAYGVEA